MKKLLILLLLPLMETAIIVFVIWLFNVSLHSDFKSIWLLEPESLMCFAGFYLTFFLVKIFVFFTKFDWGI